MEFKLLPHKYQKTAVWILAVEILLTVVSFVVSFSAPSSSLDAFFKSGFMQLFITIGFYLAFVFLAFSRESVEDEYITSCRLKSVAITAVASVCFVVLLDLVQAFLHGTAYAALKEWRQSFFWAGNYQLWLLIIYEVIFKILVKRYFTDDEDEEQY